MGVADLVTGDPAEVHVTNHCVAGETVVHVAEQAGSLAVGAAPQRLGADAHAQRLAPAGAELHHGPFASGPAVSYARYIESIYRARNAGLELAILGALVESDLHGYELKKRLADTLGLVARVSFGSLYPALARLEAAGAVRSTLQPYRGSLPVPLTGSLTGELAAARARLEGRARRARKVYRLTDSGRELFTQLLEELQPADDDRGFTLRLALARHLPPEGRLKLLERRRAALAERLAQARQTLAAARQRLDTYAGALAARDAEAALLDLSWLERLIDAERGQAPPKARPDPAGAGTGEPETLSSRSPRPRKKAYA
jgi:DNA-binding PadR family transcriptional regulator